MLFVLFILQLYATITEPIEQQYCIHVENTRSYCVYLFPFQLLKFSFKMGAIKIQTLKIINNNKIKINDNLPWVDCNDKFTFPLLRTLICHLIKITSIRESGKHNEPIS